jgi:enoyl-CoA hydratase/carnithine racemase
MSSRRVAWTGQGAVALVELGDGTRRNALGRTDWEALADLITSLAQRPDVRAILLSGNRGTFSAGSDMNEWVDADLTEVEDCFTSMEACFQAIEGAPVPIIASVQGVAAGAGCQLALACDLVLMATSARIGMPIARLGILASPAFAARVARRAGVAVAADLYFSGRLLSAAEAFTAGLVSRVVEDTEARHTALALAHEVASLPPPAITAAKRALAHVVPTSSGTKHEQPAPTVALRYFRDAIRGFLVDRHPA